MSSLPQEFFEAFFKQLEHKGIPYVILHSYEGFPEKIDSDVDYAVRTADLARVRGIQLELARRHGWFLAQVLQHELFAYYSVVCSRDNPKHFLKLDACSHYVRKRRFLISEDVLLEEKQRYRSFYIPSPSAEFIYVLAKVFAKSKDPQLHLARLQELFELDRERAAARFEEVFGRTTRTLAQWLAAPAQVWGQLGEAMNRRNRYGLALRAREGLRLVKRMTQPSGLHIAILGSDGAGKSTLLANLEPLLEPCFRRQLVFHFRPALFEKPDTRTTVPDPHAQPPRSAIASWLKLLYYWMDQWLGYAIKVWPARIRSTLVIFDRNFDDILIDPRRYRLQKAGWFAGMLRHLTPIPDVTLILDADPCNVHGRKPELPIPELERQLVALRKLADGSARYIALDANAPSTEVARSAWQAITKQLASRQMDANDHA